MTFNQSINQSNFYSANIPGEARFSGTTAKSVFNSKIEETVPLSPVMFTAVVEDIFKRMNIEAGININEVTLSNLRFTDDIILFAESEEKLNDMLEDLNNDGKGDRVKLNKKKTKIMCNEVARSRLRTGVMIDAD